MNTQVFAMDEMNQSLQAAPQQSTIEKKKAGSFDLDAMLSMKPTAHEPTPEEIAAINGQAAPIRATSSEPAAAQTAGKDRSTLPKSVFPAVMRELMEEACENGHISFEMMVLPALTALSICAMGKAVVSHPNGAGYTEPLMLYTLTNAPPSAKKSFAISPLAAPIIEYQKRYNKEHRADIRAYAAKKEQYESRMRRNSPEEIDKAAKEYAALQEVHKKTLLVSDITPEKLAQAMYANGGKMGVMDAEGGMFDTLLIQSAKSDIANITIFLKAYSGELHTVMRATKDDIELECPMLAMGLMVQPEQLNKIAANEQFAGRGLLQRFMIASPPDVPDGYYAKPIKDSTRRKYNEMMQNLLKQETPEEPPILLFDDAAESVMRQYWHTLDKKMNDKNNFIHGQILEWYKKHFGRAIRLAGLLHIAEHSTKEKISKETAYAAVTLAKWAEAQYMQVWSNTKTDRIKDLAENLYLKLRNRPKDKPEVITMTDITRAMRKEDADTKRAVIDYLCESGIFEELEPEERKGTGRPPKEKYKLTADHSRKAQQSFFE